MSTTKSYHETVKSVYRQAAETPAENLCCVPQSPMHLPGLHVPPVMHEMNYGCGTTIHLRDMKPQQQVLYVGVGGGLEALQLAYFTRRPGGVVAVDPVSDMRDAARRNLRLAADSNDWFDPAFIRLVDGDALDLPVEDDRVDLVAQNCLFNIFRTGGDLEKALSEARRVLRPAGRLVMSDPITPRPIPEPLRDDARLRAECLSGCLTLEAYLELIEKAGFGASEIRSRRPYRLLAAADHEALDEDLLLETIEIACFNTPVPEDGACVFTGRTAIYSGPDPSFDDGRGHVLARNRPLPVCDKTAAALERLQRADILVTDSTWHDPGGGCC